MNRIRSEGNTVIFISHDLPEILKMSDTITILCDGDYIATVKSADMDEESLKKLMVGREVTGGYSRADYGEPVSDEVVMSVKDVTVPGLIHDISFDLHKGEILGFGGLFKTPVVGQTYLAAAVNAPVTVMSTASEGGPWGMALLALYMLEKKEAGNESFPALETWLEDKIFCRFEGTTIEPDAADVAGFETFTDHYSGGLDAERAAVECMRW